jgi:hypothetical protein
MMYFSLRKALRAKEAEMKEIEEIYVGWKEIMSAFRVRSLSTMKKKVKKYGIPILRVARKPTISINEVREWREAREKRRNLKKEEVN